MFSFPEASTSACSAGLRSLSPKVLRPSNQLRTTVLDCISVYLKPTSLYFVPATRFTTPGQIHNFDRVIKNSEIYKLRGTNNGIWNIWDELPSERDADIMNESREFVSLLLLKANAHFMFYGKISKTHKYMTDLDSHSSWELLFFFRKRLSGEASGTYIQVWQKY